ncbi:peptidoglycan-binding protein [Streptomyces sp. NPDC093225]|uniref:peptidoglycan-binding protein n=1 Tax=Streptomyces sp. NPDC093225 TaxID=3366034 RepID=UPI0037F37A1F
MSDERCPDCNAARSAGCTCAPTTGYDPLRIRPYVTRPNRPTGASDWSPTGTGGTDHGPTAPATPGPGTAAPGTPGYGPTGPGPAGPHDTADAGRGEPHPVLGVVQPPNAMTQPFPAFGTPQPAAPHPEGAPGSHPEPPPYDGTTPPPHPGDPGRPVAPAEEYATQPLPVTPAATEHDPAHEPGGDTMMLRAVALPHGPRGVAPQVSGPRAAGRGQGRGRRSGREGRPVPLMAGAAVAVLATAALVAFMVPGDEDGDQAVAGARPARTSGADAPTSSADSEVPGASAAPSSADPEASTSPEASDTPSPSASADPTESPSADPSTPASTPSPRPTRSKAADPGGPTLSTGDAGAEVTELQRRLAEWGTYRGPVNGHYTSKLRSAVADFQDSAHVSGDPSGVYGPATRQVLEKITHEP